MDNKTLTARIAKNLGREHKDVNTLIAALAASLRDHCGALDAVAIPGFGTFEAIKEDETIVTDRVTGGRMLLPPSISVTFNPSALLRKKIVQTR